VTVPDPTREHLSIARQMRANARRNGWFEGRSRTQMATVASRRWTRAATTPELVVCLLLTRDRGAHTAGWWRNAECEFCWHLSVSARERAAYAAAEASRTPGAEVAYEAVPRDELRYWSRLFFGEHVDKLWHEPGGGDPSLTPEEAHRRREITHMRLFLHPVTMEPFIPRGEVYTLTRWIDGLTPAKVDR
jgi:hypothetical protein